MFVSIPDVKELLNRYDKLRSIANSGSSDKEITSKFKALRPIFEYRLLKKFSTSFYAVPFASNLIRKEIRFTLTTILRLYEMDYLRTERKNQSSQDAINIIKDYLNEVPRRSSLTEKVNNNLWNILFFMVGITPIIVSIGLPTMKILLIIIGLIILVPSLPPYLILRSFIYVEERRWYKKWMNKLSIKDLKQKITKELVDLNDKTYTELDAKYK